MDEVLRRRDAGEIAWRFLPVHRTEADPLGARNEGETRLFRFMQDRGKKTRELLPYLLRYVREHRFPLYSRYHRRSGAAELELEGTFMAMGRPWIAHDCLDTLEFSRVALMPHFSRRGPNGIWELRRDVNHPFELRLKNTAAYIQQTPDGLPNRICHVGEFGSECQVIEVFATREHALEDAEEQRNLGAPELRVARIEGTPLLDMLSYADVIELFTPDGTLTELCLTHMGTVASADDDQTIPRASAEAVLDTLVDACGADRQRA